jgi:hypothetical protein
LSTSGRARAAAAAVAALVLAASSAARAQGDFEYSLRVQNDIRFDVDRAWEVVPDESDGVGSVVRDSGTSRYSRNEASLRVKLHASPVPRVRFVGDVELVWLNWSEETLSLAALTDRSSIDPWRLEAHAVYVDIEDLLPGLDLRVGRQKILWGSADLFNPTDNLNPDDLEDQLLFGDNIANEMIRLDYTYIPERLEWLEEVSVSLVWVPVFRPAQVPWASTLSPYLGDPLDILEDDVREASQRTRSVVDEWMYDPIVWVEQPEVTLANSQVGLRLVARMLGTDFSLSWYRGFEDIPVMTRVDTVLAEDDEHWNTTVTMTYPRMHVFGFDVNGQISWLGDMGFWFEGAVMFPERVPLRVSTYGPPLFPQARLSEGTAVESRPFFKWTLGFDHSLGEHVWIDVQWVHGFIDDFGATQLNDFLVAGLEVKLWSDRLLLRFFGLLQLDWIDDAIRGDPYGHELSASLRPSIRLNPWGSIELEVGAMIPLGGAEREWPAGSADSALSNEAPYGGGRSYFGDPTSGSTTVYLRVRAAM